MEQRVYFGHQLQLKGCLWITNKRVFGSMGSLEWVQNDPNYLKYNAANSATKVLERGFNESGFSKNFSRIKYGHPEGYLSAFSNLYKEIALKINSKNSKKSFLFSNSV